MIKYKLKCKSKYCLEEKGFDGWFQNMDAFDNQKTQGLVNCPICGSDKVVKSLTTPSLKTTKNRYVEDKKNKNNSTSVVEDGILNSENLRNVSTILRTIKKEIQKNSTFVGNGFVSQVRSMKEGKIKEKPIHGHGTDREIQDLRDEGIEVANIPWISEDH